MLSWLGRFILATTALAPISLAYAWAACLQEKWLVAWLLVASAPVLLALCFHFLNSAIKKYERTDITPVAAEAADRESVGLIVLYLIPLFTYKFTDLQWEVIVPCMVVLGVIVSTGYNFYFSPLLGILGWHSYKITDKVGISYVIITKRQLRSAIQKFEVVQLTEYLLLDTKGK